VVCDGGLKLWPSATFAEMPRPQVLCIPGGGGQIDLMDDRPTLDWVRDAAADARWVTSVCTGAFLLGAAGLLRGFRATSHCGRASPTGSRAARPRPGGSEGVA
jgi:cyclohexyl-isocyanide hydratase